MRGKATDHRDQFQQMRDHPRLCGEKEGTATKDKVVAGSPPPMRGKGSKRIFSHLPSRITPAYAGKRCRMRLHDYGGEDHPRLCGEKFSGIWENIKGVGSPPPMRGKVYTS